MFCYIHCYFGSHILNHIQGLPEFCDAACRLALGANAPCLAENRAAGVQTLSGTGALRLAADFLFNFFGGKETTVFYSKPTWGNHIDIYKRAGFTKLTPYTYWNDETKCADIGQFIADLENAPGKSIILFHACAHNPTGADPSQDDWKKLADVCERKGHFPIFDTAYQVCSGNVTWNTFSNVIGCRMRPENQKF